LVFTLTAIRSDVVNSLINLADAINVSACVANVKRLLALIVISSLPQMSKTSAL